MIVYHGSNRNFNKLRISRKLVQSDSTLHNEGLGIYFSLDKDVAKTYGKYLYTIKIDDRYFRDYTKKSTCLAYVKVIVQDIKNITDVDITRYMDLDNFVTRMKNGQQAIATVGADIIELLDNNAQFYFAFSETRKEKVYRVLRKVDRNLKLAYRFTYNIKYVGVIKTDDENIAKIVWKETIK